MQKGLDGQPNHYSLESAAAPGSYVTTYNQTNIGKPGFCHYTICVPVVVASPAAQTGADSTAFANASSFALPMASDFQEYSSALGGDTPVLPLPVPSSYLGGADLSPVLPGCPLDVQRFLYPDGDDLILRFDIANPSHANSSQEIYSLAMSVPFDQYFSGRTLEQIGEQCSFADPYVGGG